ncbi:MAG: DNA polymerase III subunit gamma/tau [Clostridia bacterium]|nr:DNA polymerase III subunit gamma/tau [Clostridia bacterium]
MHQALYRKWRPRTFEDVCGQEHITSILKYEAMEGAFCHAYLFCGSRGTGKTTCAKILAKAVNCESPVNGSPCGVCAACRAIDSGAATDVLEMDAASNNGVDNIRDIRDEVVYPPSLLKYRVYIIDEVHMLSGSAFNALLKTLEEPPSYVIFILATTEMHKLPATIISRCQRFEFRRIATPVLRDRLRFIAGQEGIELDDDAALLLAKLAQGGMRDAISLMELCAGARRRIDVALVNETVGLTGRDAMLRVVNAIADKNYEALYAQIHEVVQSAKDLSVFWQDLISFYRDMLVVKTTKNYVTYLDLTDEESRQLTEVSARFSKETLLFHQKLLDAALITMQGANALKRVSAEMTLTRMCDEALNTSNEALLCRIARLEEQLMSGAWRASTTASVAEDIPKDTPVSVGEETLKGETVAPVAPSAAQTTPKKESEAPAKRTLRPLRVWAEVVARLTAQAPMSASFVRNAQAYETEDHKVLLRFDNEFSMMMLDRDDTKDLLRGALSVCLQREVRESDLLCQIMPQTSTGCAIDEIIEALDDAES